MNTKRRQSIDYDLLFRLTEAVNVFPSLKTFRQIYTLDVRGAHFLRFDSFVFFLFGLVPMRGPRSRPQVEREDWEAQSRGRKKIVQNRRLLICNRENIFVPVTRCFTSPVSWL